MIRRRDRRRAARSTGSAGAHLGDAVGHIHDLDPGAVDLQGGGDLVVHRLGDAGFQIGGHGLSSAIARAVHVLLQLLHQVMRPRNGRVAQPRQNVTPMGWPYRSPAKPIR